ncbi:MAG: hypothetical protein HYW25_00915 [Candidatus Aenigmarchaeota archaeon]|nr:hypothetical protein [Candidatus Aenigmarchaeota archaeon]
MVQVTSVLVAIVIFVIVLAIALMLLGGIVPGVDSVIDRFKEFVSGIR